MLNNARVSSTVCADWIIIHVFTLDNALIYRGCAMDIPIAPMVQMKSIVFVPRMSFNAANVYVVEDVRIKPRFLIFSAFSNHRFKTEVLIA